MAKVKDLTGQKFGRLTVIERKESDKYGNALWLCKCECGNEKVVNGYNLRKGMSTSCGCLKKERASEILKTKVNVEGKVVHNFIDLTGQKFGRLTVIKRVENKGEQPYWLCKCECGNEKAVAGNSLRKGLSTSCGCLQKEKAKEYNTKDLTGQKFGRLTVIKRVENKGKNVCWLCKCECGNEKVILGDSLRSGTTMSCGCLRSEKMSETMKERAEKLWQDEEMKWKMGYKGGITPITNYLRYKNKQWFEDCKQKANYTCQLTGKHGCKLNTHHLKAFSTIVIEAHILHNIQIKDQVKDYTQEELKLLEEYVGSWHKDNNNAVVLSEDAHNLFHKLYGKGENTPEQFEEFKERYLAGEFKEILN